MSRKIVILGLSITSSWGNGHATTFRGLVRAMTQQGHDVLFLERDKPWYAENRDMPHPPYGRTHLYAGLDELERQWHDEVAAADAVIVGSFVPDGPDVIDWVRRTALGTVAFYDIDTPVTMEALRRDRCDYIRQDQVPQIDLYLSFTGGPVLDELEQSLGAPRAVPLYCAVDPSVHGRDLDAEPTFALGYLGTYSDDRQPVLERLLVDVARRQPDERFVVAGSQYPKEVRWPDNVTHLKHVPPPEHGAFYSSQRMTVNVTRASMIRAGWAPSVRLFEAAACATPVISDRWPGMEDFFEPGREILLAEGPDEVEAHMALSDEDARRIGAAARRRVLKEHTADVRAQTLVQALDAAANGERPVGPGRSSARGSTGGVVA